MQWAKKITGAGIIAAILLQQIPLLPGGIPSASAQTPAFTTCSEVQNAEVIGLSYPSVMWKNPVVEVENDRILVTLAPIVSGNSSYTTSYQRVFDFYKDSTVKLSVTNSASNNAQKFEYHTVAAGTNRTYGANTVTLSAPLPPKTYTGSDGKERATMFLKVRMEKPIGSATCNTERPHIGMIPGETRNVKLKPSAYEKELDIQIRGDSTVQLLNGFDPNTEMPVIMDLSLNGRAAPFSAIGSSSVFGSKSVLSPYEPQQLQDSSTIGSYSVGDERITSRVGPFEIYRPYYGDIIECNNVKVPTLARRLPDGTVQITMDQTKPANKPVPKRYTHYRLKDQYGNVSVATTLPAPLEFGNMLEYEGIAVPAGWNSIEVFSESYKWNAVEYYTDDYYNREGNGLQKKCATVDSRASIPVEAANPATASRISSVNLIVTPDAANPRVSEYARVEAMSVNTSSGPDTQTYPIMFEVENTTIKLGTGLLYIPKTQSSSYGERGYIYYPTNTNHLFTEATGLMYQSAGKRGRVVVDDKTSPYITLPALGKARIVHNLALIHPQDPQPSAFPYGGIDRRLLIAVPGGVMTFQPDTAKKYYFSGIAQVKCVLQSQCMNTNMQTGAEEVSNPWYPTSNPSSYLILPANTLYAGASGFVIDLFTDQSWPLQSLGKLELGSIAGYTAILPTPTDNAAPVVTGVSVVPQNEVVSGYTNSTNVRFRATIQDETAVSCEIVQNGISSSIACSTGYNDLPVVLTGNDGSKTITLRVKDSLNRTTEVNGTIILDRAAPTIQGTEAINNMSWQKQDTPFTLTCNDSAVGCRDIRYEFISGYRTPIAFSGSATTVNGSSASITATADQYLLIQTTDRLGNSGPISVLYTKIDKILPAMNTQVLVANGKSVRFDNVTGAYITNDPRLRIEMTSDDATSGIKLDTCRISQGANPVATLCENTSASVAVMPPEGYPQLPNVARSARLVYTPTSNIADGSYQYSVNVSDNALNNAAERTVRVLVDTSLPENPGNGGIGQNPTSNPESTGNSITFTLPALNDNGAGIDRIELSLSQNGQNYTLNPDQLSGNDPRITVENGKIVIRPDINGQLPTTVQIQNLPGTVTINNQTVQAEYQATFTIYDKAGNTVVVTPPVVRFDTQSPSIELISVSGTTVQGQGTSNNHYKVGDDNTLPLIFNLRETSNSTTGIPSLPLRIQTNSPAVTILAGQSNTGCSSLQNNLCVMSISYTVQDGFSGEVRFQVIDSAGNASAEVSRFVTQQDSAPTITNPNPTAPNSDVSILPRLGSRMNGNKLQITLRNLSMGSATQLTGRLEYVDSSNATQNIQANISTANGNQVLRFSLPESTSARLKEGSQTVKLYLSNEFGNVSAPIEFIVNKDSTAPVVNGFQYSWNNDTGRLTLSWSTITESSNAVTLEYKVNSGSTGTWQNITLSNGQNSVELPASITGDNATVDVRFGDGEVYSLDQAFTEISSPNKSETNVAKKDIAISFMPDVTTGSLFVRFATAAGVNVADFQSLLTTVTRPDGTQQQSTVPPVPADATLMTVELARRGLYNVLSELRYTANPTALLTFNNGVGVGDIIPPRATLVLEGDNVTFENGIYYVRGDTTPTLRATIDGSLEESYPVRVDARMLVNGNPVTIGTAQNITTPTGAVTFPATLEEDQTYYLAATFTDAEGREGYANIQVVKDSSVQIVSSRLLNAEGQAVTATDSANNLYAKQRTGLRLEVIVANEADTLSYYLNDTLINNPAAVGNLPAGQKGVLIPVPDLTDNTLHTLTLKVVDTANNEGNRTLTLRVDNQGPTVNGTITLPAQSNTATITLAGVTVTDFSPVRYKVTTSSQSFEEIFSNNIILPEGNNTFRLSFLDSLGNETVVNNNQQYTVFVDAQAPQAEVTLTPASTKERNAVVQINNINDTSDTLNYEIASGTLILTTGSIQRSAYNATSININLTPLINTNSPIQVRLRDSAQNTNVFNLTIKQDETGPAVVFGNTSTINGGIGIGWPVTISDKLSDVQTVTGIITNLTTGETFTIANDAWQRGENGLYITGLLPPDIRPESEYSLRVTATDSLSNTTTASSVGFTMPSGGANPNPLNDGPVLNPDITGNLLDVTVTNGRDITFTVEDMPRGTQIILDYVLDQYNTQNPANQINILPIGTYTITIVDENNNKQVSTHTITPYYWNTNADLNGDGFGGGITDHRLFQEAKRDQRYDLNNPAIITLVNTTDSIISNRIENQYAQFLEEK